MREIKFRAWDKTCTQFNRFISIELDGSFTKKNSEHKFCNHEIQQFTGLKDKNGKEIYEGDVIKLVNFINTYKVVWGELSWTLEGLYAVEDARGVNTKGRLLQFNPKYGKVIGNIYENSELLKEDNG